MDSTQKRKEVRLMTSEAKIFIWRVLSKAIMRLQRNAAAQDILRSMIDDLVV